jgi:hypothetical protein
MSAAYVKCQNNNVKCQNNNVTICAASKQPAPIDSALQIKETIHEQAKHLSPKSAL